MEIKIVNKPLQNENTKPEDVQYVGETWCVNQSSYIDMKQFTKAINYYESKGAKTMYLYQIEHNIQDIVIGMVDGVPVTQEQMRVYVRADYKK